MKSYLKELQCSRCGTSFSADVLRNLCSSCSSPLLVRYDLSEIERVTSKSDFGYRVHSLWRYRELLPVVNPENIITLEEGFTPLIPGEHLGPAMGVHRLFFKDESQNPTGSFKARGLSVAISRARELGAKAIALSTAGNAGGAAAAYAARGGLVCHVFVPADTPSVFLQECRAYGADVRTVSGVITDAAREMQHSLWEEGWFDVSTCKEPYRIEGKKTILLEIAQQLGWRLPEVIIFPTGGGTGIISGWKACLELRQLGWIHRFKMPRLIAVQAEGCAPIVQAFRDGKEFAVEWRNPQTEALGLKVPKAVGDFLILQAIRESEGTAVTVTEEEIRIARRELSSAEGLFVSPEAATGYAAFKNLIEQKVVDREETVIILLTGSGLKYPYR